MFQYVWIIILGLLWLAFTIRAIIDGIQYLICRIKIRDSRFNFCGGWALCWIICHIVFLFAASIIYYHQLHG